MCYQIFGKRKDRQVKKGKSVRVNKNWGGGGGGGGGGEREGELLIPLLIPPKTVQHCFSPGIFSSYFARPFFLGISVVQASL